MADHDPVCPVSEGSCCPWMGDCDCQCLCDWIARVREDERNVFNRAVAMKRFEEKQQAYAEGITEGRRRSSKESRQSHKDASQSGQIFGRATALRDAVEAVRLSPSADIELVERSQVIDAIEALGGER